MSDIAVILAGGLGKRLLPLTEILPKTTLPIGNKSILESLIFLLKKSILLQTIYMMQL